MGRPSALTSGQYEGDGMWMACRSACSSSACPAAPGPPTACSSRRSGSCPTAAPGPSPSAAPAITGASRPSSVSAYLRCQKSSTECTTGTASKLCGGGGDVVAHSRVRASQGSSPAISPCLRDHHTLYMKTTMDAAIMNAPTVETKFQKFQPAKGEYR